MGSHSHLEKQLYLRLGYLRLKSLVVKTAVDANESPFSRKPKLWLLCKIFLTFFSESCKKKKKEKN